MRAIAIAVIFISSFAGCSDEQAQLCEPTTAGPHWLTEGQQVNAVIACATDNSLEGVDIVIDNLPAGAVFDDVTHAITWTPGLDQAAVYDLNVVVGAPYNEEVAVRIGVADAWDNPNNTAIVNANDYPLEYGLPVLFLQAEPAQSEYEPTTVIYRGRTWDAEAKLRGATSLGYPKRSYTLRFPRGNRFFDQEYDFINRRKVVLITSFDDNSYVRQRLAFEMWNRLAETNIKMRTASVVLYLDGEFRGVYTLADHVDRHLMDHYGLNEDGNLYKAITHDANFRLITNTGDAKSPLDLGFVKKEGCGSDGDEPPCAGGTFEDINALTSFVATADDSNFRAEIANRIQLADYESWWGLAVLSLAYDSAGKNSYHYHDPNGGLWRVVPWDFNASFGQAYTTHRNSAEEEADFTNRNEIFTRLLADPALSSSITGRLEQALSGALSRTAMLELYDQMQAKIAPVAARDWARWGDEYRAYDVWSQRDDFTSYAQEGTYVRQWLNTRWDFLNAP